jgi:CPA2 family monovalent cation:H+ antiporter-2
MALLLLVHIRLRARLRSADRAPGRISVGGRIGEALRERGLPFVVVEENRELVERLRQQGGQAVAGDASEPQELIQAGIARARMLVIAIPDAFQARQIIEAARTLNPAIETVVRTHSEEEAEPLRREKVGRVFMGEHELAVGMARHVLERVAPAEGST